MRDPLVHKNDSDARASREDESRTGVERLIFSRARATSAVHPSRTRPTQEERVATAEKITRLTLAREKRKNAKSYDHMRDGAADKKESARILEVRGRVSSLKGRSARRRARSNGVSWINESLAPFCQNDQLENDSMTIEVAPSRSSDHQRSRLAEFSRGSRY